MKTSDLMIGDLEYGVWYINPTVRYVVTVDISVLKAMEDALFFKEAYDPIPLTKEMLLNNGFISQYNDVVGISAIELTLTWDTDRWFANWGNIQIRYIHELQHLLRLCGLRDLADNFKVE